MHDILCKAPLTHDHNKFLLKKNCSSTFGEKLPICRVADPHHFNADPDQAFHLHGDPESAFNADLDPVPNRSDGNL
jgi:hypothetical protein